jgi:predicted nucleic acid-binding protein
MELLTKSYIDANVIITSFIEDDERTERALKVIKDPHRRLMVGDYVRLETLPKMRFNKRLEEVAFTEDILKKAIYIPSSEVVIKQAHFLAETYGLASMDALHAATARDTRRVLASRWGPSRRQGQGHRVNAGYPALPRGAGGSHPTRGRRAVNAKENRQWDKGFTGPSWPC